MSIRSKTEQLSLRFPPGQIRDGIDARQLFVLRKEHVPPGPFPVLHLELGTRLQEGRIQLRQKPMIQRGEHVVQTVIAEARQNLELRSLRVRPVNDGRHLVDAEVDVLTEMEIVEK